MEYWGELDVDTHKYTPYEHRGGKEEKVEAEADNKMKMTNKNEKTKQNGKQHKIN